MHDEASTLPSKFNSFAQSARGVTKQRIEPNFSLEISVKLQARLQGE
jgi:hypothetical protein